MLKGLMPDFILEKIREELRIKDFILRNVSYIHSSERIIEIEPSNSQTYSKIKAILSPFHE